MPGFGQQIQSGLGDFAKAVSVDAIKGTGQVAKDSFKGSVEALTGMNMNPQTQVGNVGGPNGEMERMKKIEELKAKNQQATQTRFNQVKSELEEYVRKKKAEEEQKKQMVMQREEQKVRAEQEQKESKKKLSIRNLIKSATKGTGEKQKNKF